MAENRTTLEQIFGEKKDATFELQLQDENDLDLASGQVTTVTMTLYAQNNNGKPVINSNSGINVMNANQGTLSGTGLLTLKLVGLDMAVLNASCDVEWHRILLEWTYALGAKSGYHEIDFRVRNLQKVS